MQYGNHNWNYELKNTKAMNQTSTVNTPQIAIH